MLFPCENIPIRLLGAIELIRKEGRIYNNYRNSYWTLSIRVEGNTDFYIDGKTVNISQGEILMIPPNLIYSQYTKGEHIFAIHFEAIKHFRAETLKKQTVGDWKKLCSLFKDIYALQTQKPKGWYYKASALLYELIGLLQTEADLIETKASDSIDLAAEYLEKYYTDPSLTVSRLADISGYSEAYFRRLFLNRFGTTPSDRIDHLRLERAKRLLESREFTMAEIAERIGISEPKYFSTWFKKHTKISPRDYINRLVG